MPSKDYTSAGFKIDLRYTKDGYNTSSGQSHCCSAEPYLIAKSDENDKITGEINTKYDSSEEDDEDNQKILDLSGEFEIQVCS